MLKWYYTVVFVIFYAVPILAENRYQVDFIMINKEKAVVKLREHLKELTVTIGDRSVYRPANLKRAEEYIESVYKETGLPVEKEQPSGGPRGIHERCILSEHSSAKLKRDGGLNSKTISLGRNLWIKISKEFIS